MNLPSSLVAAPRLSSATLVIAHEVNQKTRFRMEEVETVFGGFISGPAQATNANGPVPHEAPRLVLKQGHKLLSFSNANVQLSMDFDENKMELGSAFEIAERNASQLLSLLPKYQDPSTLREIGFIFTVLYRARDGVAVGDILSKLADQYSGPRLGKFVSFDLRVGFDTDDGFYTNFALNGYELRKATFNPSDSPGMMRFNVDELPLEEHGIQVMIDINNRPSVNLAKEDFQGFCSKLFVKAGDVVMRQHIDFLGPKP